MLVIVGALDTPFLLAAADYMTQQLPASRKVAIENAAHLPNLERPDELNRAVAEFLAEI